jgi:hypothetical protein
VGPFSPVFVNEGLTFDFDESEDCSAVALLLSCFAGGVRRDPGASCGHQGSGAAWTCGPENRYGPWRSIVYWNEPGGHVWELLTESYARQPK